MRRRLADLLRRWADRVDDTSGPRMMGPHSFTIEPREGVRFRTDGRGTPLCYLMEHYHLAHDEADTEHTVVLWRNIVEGKVPFTRRAGGLS
jgi:hypothetical protein